MREYNTNLPQVLVIAKRIETTKIYQKLEIAKNNEISYREGWADEDNDDSDDDVNKEIQEAVNNQWPRVVKYGGPLTGILLSIALCLILIIFSFVKDITKVIAESDENSLTSLKKEFPFFMMSVIYPIPYFVSTWFIIFFLEWQRKIYESVRRVIDEQCTYLHQSMIAPKLVKILLRWLKKHFKSV